MNIMIHPTPYGTIPAALLAIVAIGATATSAIGGNLRLPLQMRP
jgi:hypothetical protein